MINISGECFPLVTTASQLSTYLTKSKYNEEMSSSLTTTTIQSIAITGGNAGIGKEFARLLLANHTGVNRLVMLCRSRDKALEAAQELKASSKNENVKVDVVVLDLLDPQGIQQVIDEWTEPVDVLVMNAGGLVSDPNTSQDSGVTKMVATNLLGHSQLVEGLMSKQMIQQKILYAGSEASRGAREMFMPAPAIQNGSVEEFVDMCNGKFYGRLATDMGTTYAGTKTMGTFYMGALSQRYPKQKFITVSPGHTAGTDLMNKPDLPTIAKYFMKYIVLPLQLWLGIAHTVSDAANRYVQVLMNDDDKFKSGGFYASVSGLTGPIGDQAQLYDDKFDDKTYQNHAYEALHRFLKN